MAQLLGTPENTMRFRQSLRVIFKDPMAPDAVEVGWQTADDYLSGDKKQAAYVAQMAADRILPSTSMWKPCRKHSRRTWMRPRLMCVWVQHGLMPIIFSSSWRKPLKHVVLLARSIEVKFSELTAEWRINGKSSPNYNDDVAAYVTYGTAGNAYRILEETLNLKDIRIYDTIEDADGKQKRVLNKKKLPWHSRNSRQSRMRSEIGFGEIRTDEKPFPPSTTNF